jgi:hypothetical protein
MNFSQLHEQLRLELLRRIERGVLSGTLLARQTGLKSAHISNFLHSKRRLSLDALDRVLSAQSITIDELLPPSPRRNIRSREENTAQSNRIALVSQPAAMYEAQIRQSSILELIPIPPGYLDHLRTRRSQDRRSWDRFVAVRVSYAQAETMAPAIAPHAILVIDRHYNSMVSCHPPAPNIYAIQLGGALIFRYATLQGNNIILRPYKIEHPVDLIELKPEESPGSLIVGRVCVSLSEV